MGSLSDWRENVCIPYPDEQRTWIAEGRNVGHVYGDQEIQQRYERLKVSFPELTRTVFSGFQVIDLHADGKNNYFYWGVVYIFSGG